MADISDRPMPLRRQQMRDVQCDGDQRIAAAFHGEGVAAPVGGDCGQEAL